MQSPELVIGGGIADDPPALEPVEVGNGIGLLPPVAPTEPPDPGGGGLSVPPEPIICGGWPPTPFDVGFGDGATDPADPGAGPPPPAPGPGPGLGADAPGP